MDRPRYVTLTGTKHYYGGSILRVDQRVKLVKEYDNPYDDEAIRVEIEGFGQVGYVGNSTHTVARGSQSAGRIYDTFGDSCCGRIRFILKGEAIVELEEGGMGGRTDLL